ncbi:MAG: hypothetical protein CVV41_10290 [Candidatus Riflebacteria bacterium HGW-Riflebacteria-1]|jgi:hypothetical protein|nr:MAG: hypothetical protein CVV41_10290 [Candidatus Riflebacteria bacterium HGW-Riflebacteria-1]
MVERKKSARKMATAFFCSAALAMLTVFCLEPAQAGGEQSFPPFYVRKVAPGDQFTPFSLVDLNGKTWSNRDYLTRPLLLITGKWELRHDLRKWAEHLNLNYIQQADILWVFNPSNNSWFTDRLKRSQEAFTIFNPKVPTVIDSHSMIGRSLKIEYDIPTIIGIDRQNRFQFTLESPFNKPGSDKLAALVRTKLLHN